MKKIIICVCVILAILIGIWIGIELYNSSNNNTDNNNIVNLNESLDYTNNTDILSINTSGSEEEKTTPNTLIIYQIYHTKCEHYTKEYENIDTSLVNCNKEEIKEKLKEWDIEEFSATEIVLSKEEENFCNQHYKLKITDNLLIIYNIDEDGKETEYEVTDITDEYLTEEDILKLKSGIIIYGKENLTSTLEDYE